MSRPTFISNLAFTSPLSDDNPNYYDKKTWCTLHDYHKCLVCNKEYLSLYSLEKCQDHLTLDVKCR